MHEEYKRYSLHYLKLGEIRRYCARFIFLYKFLNGLKHLQEIKLIAERLVENYVTCHSFLTATYGTIT